MKLEGEQVLFRVFVDLAKKFDFIFPLYKHLISLGIKSNLAGLTVIRSLRGFVKDRYIKTLNILEIVDKPERVNLFLEKCGDYLKDVIFTVERAHVFIYRTKSEEKGIKKKQLIVDTVEYSRKKEVNMVNTTEKVLLRIFVGDSDRDMTSGKHLYDVIFEEAKKQDFLVGVVYKGIMGFGKAGRISAVDTVELSGDLPVIIEVIGDEEKIGRFLEFCDKHIGDGLVTMERIMMYIHQEK